MKRISTTPPTRKDLITLRLMILTGCIAMGFFLYHVLGHSVRGYAPLYWLLMTTFAFTCLKLLYEWYHYLHITVPKTPPLTRDFTVDIFTTFFAGEPYEMIVRTLNAVKAITYPHETYLCDEADDPYLKAVCKQLGVHHVTRTDKKDAKAGNINNALKQSAGEICVVLDPDHVPFPDFLDPIIPHFTDPKIGFVQVVQAYSNNDESLIAKGAAQQTYQFYGPMMMTMNHYGTVQAIGANCTFRRTALDSIGGHAAGLAEDMHTSMQLHAKGWQSVYVPEVLARGLAPSTLSAYYKQQLKWSRGVFDLLVTAYPKLFSQFSWRQKLHYGLLPMHYMSGLIYLINFLIPVIALFFGVSPMQIDISEFGLAFFPLVASIVLIRHFVQWWVMEDEERGFHMVGGLLLIGTWWIFILGLVYTIAGKKVPYNPTPKDGNEANNWPLSIPNFIILAISGAAIGYGLLTDWNPYNLIMACFAALNCLLMCVNIAASRQQQFRLARARYPWLNAVMSRIKILKGYWWIIRHQIYTGLRRMALLITLLLIGGWVYLAQEKLLENEQRIAQEQSLHALRGELASQNNASDSNAIAATSPAKTAQTHAARWFAATRGVNYLKGIDWYKNYHAFTKKELVSDFAEMKSIGINCVKFYGPSFYDRNILRVAGQYGMNLHYGFWIPEEINFRAGKQELKTLSETIISTVRKHKGNPAIVSWNIGNAVFQKLAQRYPQPELARQQEAYLNWLAALAAKMKKIDGNRPITLDIQASGTAAASAAKIRAKIPEIAAFGLVYGKNEPIHAGLIDFPHFISYATVDAYEKRSGETAGIFISNWQDVHTSDRVSFDGLKDQAGRRKNTFLQLAARWKGSSRPLVVPPIKILKPAAGTFAGAKLDYHAMIRKDGAWMLLKDLKTNLHFEWKLVRNDGLGESVEMQEVGTGPSLTLHIPEHPEFYQLYLFVLKGNTILDISNSSLNTPLQ